MTGGPRLVEPRDLARLPGWALAKLLYAFAPVSLHFRLAALAGTVESLRSPHRRSFLGILEEHLGETHGERERRRVARQHFQTRAKGRFCDVWPQVHGFAGLDRVRVDGLEHLDAALAAGRGAILAGGHFGHGRMLKPILRARGYRPLVVGDPVEARGDDPRRRLTRAGGLVHRLLRLPRASQHDARWQRELGNDLVACLDVRPLLAALGRNEALVIMADGRNAQTLRMQRVGGIEVAFAPGVVRLARETGAALLPSFVVDDPDRKGVETLRLVIHPPLELAADDDVDADLARLAGVWEEQLRTHPHDWLWGWMREGRFDRPWRDGRAPEAAAGARG